MPYDSINDLPKTVRNLPRHAKSLYLKAFNSAWEDSSGKLTDDTSRDRVAHEYAWSAVRCEYEKDDETGEWLKKAEVRGSRRAKRISRRQR